MQRPACGGDWSAAVVPAGRRHFGRARRSAALTGHDPQRTAGHAGVLEDGGRHLILETLDRAGGNAVRAAKALALSRSAFYRRLQRYGMGPGGCSRSGAGETGWARWRRRAVEIV